MEHRAAGESPNSKMYFLTSPRTQGSGLGGGARGDHERLTFPAGMH